MSDLKLEIKAYKCVFPGFFIDAYNQYMWQDDKQFELIYGKNQKEAVKKKCSNNEFYSFWELKSHIKTRRFPEMDLYSQEKSPLLNSLTEKQIGHLLHSLGAEIGGRYPSGFYRNYSFYNSNNPDCDHLVSIGLMENQNYNGEKGQYYHVTPKGIAAVKTLLLVRKEAPNA